MTTARIAALKERVERAGWPHAPGSLPVVYVGDLCDWLDELASAAPEICICAAIRTKDGTIVRGHRHDGAMATAYNMKQSPSAKPEDQGFITSYNRYVDRVVGMQLQRAAGAKSAMSPDGELHGDVLFSEDLY